MGSLHPSLWCRELSCPLLCSPLAHPVQGSFPVSAWDCWGPSGRSPTAGALHPSSWLGCAMARTSSCTAATCPAGAGRVLSCPPCFLGQDLALLFSGFPTQFGGSAAMARVTQLGGLALPSTDATAHERTRGVCGTVPLPAQHRGSAGRTLLWRGVGSGAEPGSSLVPCVTHRPAAPSGNPSSRPRPAVGMICPHCPPLVGPSLAAL